MPENIAIGVDLGGTRIRVACLSRGNVIDSLEVSHGGAFADALGDCLSAATARIADLGGTCSSLGLALPGAVSVSGKGIMHAPTLPGAETVDFAALVKDMAPKMPQPRLVNDANAAALAEWHRLAPAPRQMIYLRLGTGVGGAVITDGQIFLGPGGLGGELGHVIAGTDGRICGCGAIDCLEAYAGGRAIECRYALVEKPASLPQIHARSTCGDILAGKLMEDAFAALGRAIGTLTNIFNPDLIMLDGRPLNLIAPVLSDLEATARQHMMPLASRGITLRKSTIGENAGAIGAGLLASIKQQGRSGG